MKRFKFEQYHVIHLGMGMGYYSLNDGPVSRPSDAEKYNGDVGKKALKNILRRYPEATLRFLEVYQTVIKIK